MRIMLFLALIVFAPLPAFAGTAEAKDVAKSYNCKVTNIAAVSADTGESAATTYKADCELPAGLTDEQKKANGSMLIRCESTMCSLYKKGA
jgi:hypothetical protein